MSDSHEHRDHRPQDNLVDAKNSDAPKSGEEHHIVRQLCILTDWDRTQDIVDHADHQHAVRNKNDTLPRSAGYEKENRDRHSHQPRTDGEHQRQKRHQHGPNIQNPEDEPAKRPFRDRYDDIAIDCGADNDRELVEQSALLLRAHWNSVFDTLQQLVSVVQQKRNRFS